MTDTKRTHLAQDKSTPQDFLKEMREFAITVGEDCPEGHRRDPGSGRCLPMGSTDHTAFTRSLNDDQGDEWRGIVDKEDKTFDSENITDKEIALDADSMEDLESCAHGTTFSFIQRRCVSLEEAEIENADEFSFDEADNANHQEVVAKDPEGRRDPVGFQCPQNQFFDFKLRECIPLNKDTVMASECFDEEFKQDVATFARLAMTNPDPADGHRHVATIDDEGNGITSMSFSHGGEHNHEVKQFNVTPVTREVDGREYISQHPGVVISVEMRLEKIEELSTENSPTESSKQLTSKTRNQLADSAFGVPGKRKFPLDSCARVQNAMARFNQAKGLTPGEKAALRRKILARAKQCDIKVENFAKANTPEEFAAVVQELIYPFLQEKQDKMSRYHAESEKKSNGPCPPGMEWDPKTKRCTKVRGFFEVIKEQSNHSEVIAKDPAGRKDTLNFQCPPNHLFDFKNRKCIPMDTRVAPGQPGDTTKASQRDISPSPEGKPARLPQDCPAGTIWDADLRKCKPLDSRQKTSSVEERAQAPAAGPGKEEDDHGCAPFQTYNPITKKCEVRKGQFKGKSDSEVSANAQNENREGLVGAPAGKVKHPTDCPEGTLWDAKNKICRPLNPMDKSRSDGNSPQSPADTASVDNVVENMSLAKLISHLDVIIRQELAQGRKEKAKIAAKELPNEAFPPSLVGSTRRSLMHHTLEVTDPYDNDTVDVARLRNALARVLKVEGYAAKAVEDACEHLVFHAREIVSQYLGKS